MDINNSLLQHVQKITELPTLPVIAQEILTITENDLSSIKKLEQIIENDPAISAKILSTANSVFYGSVVPVTTLGSSILRIGLNNVKNIALGISLMTILISRKQGEAVDYSRIFNHSLSVGFVSKILSKYLDAGIDEEAVISGILHDIGFLALSKYFPDSYHQVITEFESGTPLLEAEKTVLDFNHEEIGYWLANHWKLPDNVLETTRYHHMPVLADKYPEHVAVTHLADYLTTKNILSITEKNPGYPFDYACLDILEISESDIDDIEKEVKSGSFFNKLF